LGGGCSDTKTSRLVCSSGVVLIISGKPAAGTPRVLRGSSARHCRDRVLRRSGCPTAPAEMVVERSFPFPVQVEHNDRRDFGPHDGHHPRDLRDADSGGRPSGCRLRQRRHPHPLPWTGAACERVLGGRSPFAKVYTGTSETLLGKVMIVVVGQ